MVAKQPEDSFSQQIQDLYPVIFDSYLNRYFSPKIDRIFIETALNFKENTEFKEMKKNKRPSSFSSARTFFFFSRKIFNKLECRKPQH
ncbi:hypothetical protein BpHYR1_032460 [Brachionus plicatilis]|uniref:Uncharacterized protein n=1 Tax=Brachionus plicatilis TaxID=10195 RepID=A0A3M7SUT8_BRAPC|nr:hypothetical protein BpHYR1_032460 [Brachionus plicatilis]